MSTLNNSVRTYKQQSNRQRNSISKSYKIMNCVLMILFLSILLMLSGCQSNLKPQLMEAPQTQIVLDSALMAEPNYTERLLKVLSE